MVVGEHALAACSLLANSLDKRNISSDQLVSVDLSEVTIILGLIVIVF